MAIGLMAVVLPLERYSLMEAVILYAGHMTKMPETGSRPGQMCNTIICNRGHKNI